MIRAVLRPKEKTHVQILKVLLQQTHQVEAYRKNTTAIEIKWNCSQLTFAKAIVNTEHLSTVNYTL